MQDNSKMSTAKIIEIAKELSMFNAVRHVNIRGYVKEVRVLSVYADVNDEWIVKVIDSEKTELVPSHLFYHETPSGLILRDSVEFKRRYEPTHIGIKSLPESYGR